MISESASIQNRTPLRFAAPFGVPRKTVQVNPLDTSLIGHIVSRGLSVILPAGTILVDSTEPNKHSVYNGSNGPIRGILADPLEWLADATQADPGAAYFNGVTFATERIVDYTLYVMDLIYDLPTCEFV